MCASFADEKQRNIYSRFTNPNTNEFVEKICQMEGAADGCAFATGVADVFDKANCNAQHQAANKNYNPMWFSILFYLFLCSRFREIE
jgi:cystathionine beta-lyase/cystathionine gamma-synthase